MSLPVRLDEDGAAAPPRENGELAFGAPWESRLFGLTMALVEDGRLDWEAFRGRLIARIAAWEKWASRPPAAAAGGSAGVAGAGEPWDYWQRWREAFEESLETAGLVDGSEIDGRSRRLAARPQGHDHHAHHDHQEHAVQAAGEIDE
ncbi:MAG: nitrile hydratase accessory protein [Acidobacteria bacterium]|nr:nitrile hydratase accessory protein [Acidobacteriota bacterium]